MANLFTSQTPSSTDENSGAPLTVSTTIYFTAAGTVTGGRFFAPLTVGAGTYTLKLWSVDTADPGTGTLLASKTLGTPTAGVWNSAVFDTPVSVTANTVAYRIGVGMSIGRYTATGGFFATSLTNGNIVAPENGGSPTGISVRNGVYAESETGFPVDQFNSTCYFVDVDFTVSGGLDSVTPDGLAIAATLGAPSVVTAYSVTPDGLAVATALGEPTIAMVTAVPDGLAIPVSLGAPAIVQSANPDGLSVSGALGAPTIGQAAGGGGWSDFGGIIQGAINDARLNAERRRNPIECPEHGWPLEITPRGRHCQFGGHVVIGSSY